MEKQMQTGGPDDGTNTSSARLAGLMSSLCVFFLVVCAFVLCMHTLRGGGGVGGGGWLFSSAPWVFLYLQSCLSVPLALCQGGDPPLQHAWQLLT